MPVAEDLMTKTDVAIFEDTPITEITRILRKMRVGGLPVMDKNKKFCGLVTVTDIFNAMGIVRNMFHGKPEWFSRFQDGQHMIHVKEICRRGNLSVLPTAPIEEVIEVMVREDVHTLPVMNKEQTVVFGVIGRHDITWAIFNPEGVNKAQDARPKTQENTP